MTTAEAPSGEPAVLHIAGDMTIYQAAELKPMLCAALAQPGPLEINLAGVAEIDTAGVQLLMLAKRTAQASQKELHLSAHSHAVLEAFELLGLAPYFGDPLVMTS